MIFPFEGYYMLTSVLLFVVVSPEFRQPTSQPDGGTSGIGNSVDSSWVNEQDPYIEPYLGYRNTQSSNMVINNYLSRSFEPHSHAVDLYRGETGSEESYSREFDT